MSEKNGEYKPGRRVTLEEMEALASDFAKAETRDGLDTKHVPKSDTQSLNYVMDVLWAEANDASICSCCETNPNGIPNKNCGVCDGSGLVRPKIPKTPVREDPGLKPS